MVVKYKNTFSKLLSPCNLVYFSFILMNIVYFSNFVGTFFFGRVVSSFWWLKCEYTYKAVVSNK